MTKRLFESESHYQKRVAQFGRGVQPEQPTIVRKSDPPPPMLPVVDQGLGPISPPIVPAIESVVITPIADPVRTFGGLPVIEDPNETDSLESYTERVLTPAGVPQSAWVDAVVTTPPDWWSEALLQHVRETMLPAKAALPPADVTDDDTDEAIS